MRCLPLGGSYKGGKTSATWEASSLARRSARMEGEPRGLRGERSGLFVAAGAEEEKRHRQSVPPGTPQPDVQVHWSWQGRGAGTQASGIRSGERTGAGIQCDYTWGCMNTSLWQVDIGRG